MNREAERLATSLAVLANSAMIAKGAGYTVTVPDMMPVASRMVALSKASARTDRRLARNSRRIASMTATIAAMSGPPPGAAEVERRAGAAQLPRFLPFTPNGFDKYLPTTNGRPDVPPNHPG